MDIFQNDNPAILIENVFGGVEICNYDEVFTLLYANKGFLDLVGYTMAEIRMMCSNAHTALMLPADVAAVKTQIAQQLQTQNQFSVTYRMRHKNGNILWVLDKGLLIDGPANSKAVQCTITDITALKKTEEDLKITKKQYEVAMRYSDITMFEYNVRTKELLFREKEAAFYGIGTVVPNGPETFVRNQFILPEYADVYLAMYQKIESGEKTASCFINTRDADGKMHEFELNLVNVFDDAGNPIRAVGVRKNVTHIRQLEREKEFSSIMADSQNFIYEANVTQNKIVRFNTEWAQLAGVNDIVTLDDLTRFFCKHVIMPEDEEQACQALNRGKLIAAYESGTKRIVLEYRKKADDKSSRWHRKNINIIKDAVTGDISIRCYISDIHDLKIKQLKSDEERRFYEAMIGKAAMVYAVNITKNHFISGHEKWGERFGVAQSDVYSDMIESFMQSALHPDDVAQFSQCYLRQNILDAYASGKSEISCDYRRPHVDGEYIWVRCNFHLFEDVQTGDLIGYSYVENIDEEKTRELALLYQAEHDALTALYNKTATEKHITDFLSTGEGKAGRHAFFIIDIDHFKQVNDTFGHAFGDAVISQTASKIRDLFRDIDILGRVGGDEFIALMKNISNKKTVFIKAQEIIDKLAMRFAREGTTRGISASIGIALYNEHGKTFAQLYKKSDAALYVSKNGGRNSYTIYQDTIRMMSSEVKEVKPDDFFEHKTFEENIAEYVFRILYESADKPAAINAVLELVGAHYDVSRAYVFEKQDADGRLKNTFEWCNRGIEPQIENFQDVLNEHITNCESCFSAKGVYFVPDASKLQEPLKGFAEAQGIISMLQFSITQGDAFKGFVGFDKCRRIRPLRKKETAVLQNIAHILGVFVLGMRVEEKLYAEKQMGLSIINAMDSYAYVVNPNTYEILFLNEKTLTVLPEAKIGSLCYQVIRGQDKPCKGCPMQALQEKNLNHYAMRMDNPKLGKCIRVSASWVKWTDGQTMCLLDSVDTQEILDVPVTTL